MKSPFKFLLLIIVMITGISSITSPVYAEEPIQTTESASSKVHEAHSVDEESDDDDDWDFADAARRKQETE